MQCKWDSEVTTVTIRSEGADVPAQSLEELWTPGKATAGRVVTVLVMRKTPPSSQSLPLDTALLLLALGTGLLWLKTMKESLAPFPKELGKSIYQNGVTRATASGVDHVTRLCFFWGRCPSPEKQALPEPAPSSKGITPFFSTAGSHGADVQRRPAFDKQALWAHTWI